MRHLLLSLSFAFFASAVPSLFACAENHDTLDKNELFGSSEVLQMTLSGNLRKLLGDRGETVQNHDLVLSYKNKDGAEVSLPVSVRTRGHFRKSSENCSYPPLLLQFPKTEQGQSSLFRNQTKLKLVMPCRGDEYVVREWMVYRLYNLVTTKSLKARLVSVQLEDSKKKSSAAPFYGILLEEEEQMAKRNNVVVVKKAQLQPQQTETKTFLTMAVFQYLIGNTDWSVQYQQNIKFVASDGNAVPQTVAYDFDHAGLVNAPYALPAEELQMTSVKERRYRGYCLSDMSQFAGVISLYNGLKDEIYNLYTSCPLLDAKYVKATLKYFDEFYKTINDAKTMQKQFSYPCDKSGTGNVVIKGLKKN